LAASISRFVVSPIYHLSDRKAILGKLQNFHCLDFVKLSLIYLIAEKKLNLALLSDPVADPGIFEGGCG
jgi:hypothetical protein